jgi:hypothetical protein
MADKTIREILGLNPVVAKTFNKAVPLVAADPALLYGLELEIENTHGGDWVVPGMVGKEDGSLRNGGFEYITNPMTFSNLSYVLTNFFKKSQVTADNYSERCSVHVHTNCQDLTLKQLQLLLMLYQLFERVLFKYIGNDRDKNIFCVPWHETQLHFGIVSKMDKHGLTGIKQWQKYTALNLLPLFSQGTVEFRHMAGTPNQQYILDWCNLIGSMFRYTRNNELAAVRESLASLNTTSHYRELMFDVFGNWAQHLLMPMFEQDLEEGVLQMKYSLLSNPEPQTKARYNPFLIPEPPPIWEDNVMVNPVRREPRVRERALGADIQAAVARVEEQVRQRAEVLQEADRWVVRMANAEAAIRADLPVDFDINNRNNI